MSSTPMINSFYEGSHIFKKFDGYILKISQIMEKWSYVFWAPCVWLEYFSFFGDNFFENFIK